MDIIGTLLGHIREEIDNFVDNIGMNPVHCATRSSKYRCVKKCLKIEPKTLNSQCHKGMSLLMHALESGVLNTAFLLLKNELVDVSLRDKRGNNVLFYIADLYSKKIKKNHEKLIRMVLYHQTFTREMLTKPNNEGVSILEHVANEDLIIMLLLMGKSEFYSYTLFVFSILMFLQKFRLSVKKI